LRTVEAQDTELANPPTMKNTGMIWNSHVSHWAAWAVSRMLVARRRPSSHTSAAMSQWPSITTASEATRRKST
jgi:hypothetical protein